MGVTLPMANEITLPEAAFAVVDGENKALPHHTDSVVNPSENSSVDKDALKQAVTDLADADLSTELKDKAKAHLLRHARALDMQDEVAALSVESVQAEPTIQERIEGITTFAEAEDLMLQVEESQDEALMDMAYQKVMELAAVGREQVSDAYEGKVTYHEKKEDGSYTFTAIVAQCDKVNKNRRLYPKKEFQNNLKRVNRLCKSGRFHGRDGHAGWLSDDEPSKICVRFDNVFMQDNDLIMEGTLIPTQAGQDIAVLWDHGVQTEWSIVGYGNPEYKGEGKNEYCQINDYILLGCDPVRMGAATTKTVKAVKNDGLEVEEVVEAIAEALQVEDAVVEQSVETVTNPPKETEMAKELEEKVEDKVEDQKPVAEAIDIEAITAKVMADAKAAGEKAVADAAQAARDAAQLETAKEVAIAKLSEGDEMVAKIVVRHFDHCETPEDIAKVVEEVAPLVVGLKKPKQFEGTGHIRIGHERERFMLDAAGNPVDRPETVAEVKEALLKSVKDTGTEQFDNPRFVVQKLLDNYEQNEPQYLRAMTRQGFADAATTTTALGTTLPMVLPVITGVMPKLIPFELGAVMPIDRPAARVYFQTPTYASGTNDGEAITDSTYFASDFADHSESADKSQISFEWTYTDVTAVEKAIKFKWTSALQQDLSAIWNLDVEAVMLQTATDYLALEVNQSYLECMAAGAGITAPAFGTGLPAAGWTQKSDWLRIGLTQHINRASTMIEKKMQVPAGWIVCGPTQAGLFEASHVYEKATPGSENQFGIGLNRIGTWNGAYQVYVASWAETLTNMKNKLLIGYRPPEWSRAAGVYCPYVPMYYAPMTSYAETNELARSVSTRNAWKVLQPNGLATMAISSDTGTDLEFVD